MARSPHALAFHPPSMLRALLRVPAIWYVSEWKTASSGIAPDKRLQGLMVALLLPWAVARPGSPRLDALPPSLPLLSCWPLLANRMGSCCNTKSKHRQHFNGLNGRVRNLAKHVFGSEAASGPEFPSGQSWN